ncbi:MAG: tryptophan synthase subunit alpha [Candidatus Methylomirabilota bacterium]|nr:tryptophan synthase subunit alpha [Candidatus Methylomirabilis sp.]NJD67815.1 tryptophan synthase subunit alpha [candidate division NC10 bacterium]PWB44800.1 MAG: tryptophan synthase subunit alpha [candidate division NC10 bacterium]
MNRIDERFRRLRESGERALMPYLTAGDPDLATTRSLILECERRGADLIEIGVPFSDPLADGVTIQRASQRALRGGTTLAGIIEMVADLRTDCRLPLLLMSYVNPIFHFGYTRFAKEAVAAGIDGLIVPDLPPDEATELIEAAGAYDLYTIFLIAPTSPPERIRTISAASKGFIYYVSLRGVTGARSRVSDDLETGLRIIRRETGLPLAVGFGISTPEQVRVVATMADGVIVGSAIVSLLEQTSGQPDQLQRVGEFVASLKAATRIKAVSGQ